VTLSVTPTSAQGRYGALLSERDPFLRRAEDAAKLTIPTLLPPDGYSGSSKLDQPYQSVGARGVNNLAAKILLALFPPGSSFFRLSLDDKVLEELAAEFQDEKQLESARSTVEAALGKMERAALTRLEQVGARAPLHDGVRHLLVAGNVLLQVIGRGQVRCHYLNKYVCKRDPEGNPLEIVVKECFARATLPKNALDIVEAVEKDNPENKSPANTVEVFTHVRLIDGKWEAYQEVMGREIPNTKGSYPKDKSPWIPLRFSRIEGESYGRSMVEEYMGDLRSLEALAQAIVEFAGIAATVRFLVKPGITKAERLARARNGAFIPGDAKDVTVLGLEKFADFRVAKETADTLEKRLGEGFLLGSAAVRDAERVTAEEIRLIASELEQALGGFYSVLAQELQLPLVARLLHIMTEDKTIPALPEGSVRPSIVTGLEALGRGGDLQKLDTLLAGITQIFGEDAVKERINVGDYIVRRGTALGLDLKGLVRSDEEVATSRQQTAAQGMVEKLGPQMLKNRAEQQGAATEAAEPNPE
jgi:hypothetical protein